MEDLLNRGSEEPGDGKGQGKGGGVPAGLDRVDRLARDLKLPGKLAVCQSLRGAALTDVVPQRSPQLSSSLVTIIWQTGRMSALPLTSRDAPDGGQVPLHEPCVLLKLGEIVLKGRNRQQFERLLHDNIRRAVRDIGVQIWQREGVIVVRV